MTFVEGSWRIFNGFALTTGDEMPDWLRPQGSPRELSPSTDHALVLGSGEPEE